MQVAQEEGDRRSTAGGTARPGPAEGLGTVGGGGAAQPQPDWQRAPEGARLPSLVLPPGWVRGWVVVRPKCPRGRAGPPRHPRCVPYSPRPRAVSPVGAPRGHLLATGNGPRGGGARPGRQAGRIYRLLATADFCICQGANYCL